VVFFAEEDVNVWNSLPFTVNFPSLASFKRTHTLISRLVKSIPEVSL